MSAFVTAACIAIGLILILVALRDILRTLLVPQGNAYVSGRVMRIVWRLSVRVARARPAGLMFAGPRVMLSVVVTWCALIVMGWALIYLPFLPGSFIATSNLPPEAMEGMGTAIYYSLVSLSTVGYGEIAPVTLGLRLASALQALVGFVLLSAVISWLLGVYPVLSRQRALAQEVDLLRRHEEASGRIMVEADGAAARALLADLTQRVITAESDLTHTPVAYYFAELEGRASLPVAMAYLLRRARGATAQGTDTTLRLHAELLERAIEKLAATVAANLLHDADGPDGTILAWATDHARGAEAAAALARAPAPSERRSKLKI